MGKRFFQSTEYTNVFECHRVQKTTDMISDCIFRLTFKNLYNLLSFGVVSNKNIQNYLKNCSNVPPFPVTCLCEARFSS